MQRDAAVSCHRHICVYGSTGTQPLISRESPLNAGGQVQLSGCGRGPGGAAQGGAEGLVGSQNEGISMTSSATYGATR